MMSFLCCCCVCAACLSECLKAVLYRVCFQAHYSGVGHANSWSATRLVQESVPLIHSCLLLFVHAFTFVLECSVRVGFVLQYRVPFRARAMLVSLLLLVSLFRVRSISFLSLSLSF